MKKNTRFIALMLSVMAVIAMFAMASADTSVTSGKLSAETVAVGNTVTLTISMKETTVSSIGVTVNCDSAFTVESAKWLKTGTIANYDTSKNKGAFAPGSATAISGDVFQVTFKAKTAGASAKNLSVVVVGKNGTNVVFEETVAKNVKITCTSHNFGEYAIDTNKHSRTCSTCGTVESAAHGWDAGKVTKEPTCTATGTKTYTCTTCKHTKTETIAKLNHSHGAWQKVDDTNHAKKCSCGDTITAKHNWDAGKVTTAATCSKEGVKTYTCADCKHTKTESIAKIAHTYDNSCDTACNKCGATRTITHQYGDWQKDATNHWKTCSVCKHTAHKEKHTFGNWETTKLPTEMTAGEKVRTCSVCTHQEKESIPATGCKHGAGTKVVGAKNAECGVPGYTGDTVCKTCNTVLTKGSIIAALEHEFVIENEKSASCKEDGYTGDKKCSKCNLVEPGTVIPAGEHDCELVDAKEATCTTEGHTGKQVCKACETVVSEGEVIPMTAHDYKDGVCSVCGAKDETGTSDPTTPSEPTKPSDPVQPEPEPNNNLVWILIGCGVAVVASGVVIFVIIKKRKNDEE